MVVLAIVGLNLQARPPDGASTESTSVAAATLPVPTHSDSGAGTPESTGGTPAPPPTSAAPPVVRGTVFFSAERNGRWEIYSAPIGESGSFDVWRQLTRGYSPARAPAVSSDGTRLAFQSRKDGNWEIYVLDLSSGKITRLTNNLAYDGAPAWSPDGSQLAFESYRAQDLDIWRMRADGTAPINLTADEPAYDYAPVWSPDGSHIAFTSWATGNKQIYTISADGKNLTNISNDRFHDEQPAWSPDGKQIAFVSNRETCVPEIKASLEDPPGPGTVESGNCQRRGVYVGELDSGGKLSRVRQLTFAGRDLNPTWSPDGRSILYISPRPTRQPLYVIPVEGGLPRVVSDQPVWINAAAWSDLNGVQIGSAPVNEPPLYVESPIPGDEGGGYPYNFRPMREIYLAPSYGILSSAVSSSFLALRARVKQESGIDFLGQLSDMTRLISYKCDSTCDDLSWHKAGRAVDTLLELPNKGKETVVLVREDVNAEVYWHYYVRAAVQDGSLGEPLKDAPWDISVLARSQLAPGLGGLEAPVEYGYFVDLTELMRLYGWRRISSHDDVDFDWHTNREGLEFWHFQKEDGLNWWQAMQEVYSPKDLLALFDWKVIVDQWDKEPSRVYLKQVPPPPDAWKWFALVPEK